MAKVSNTTPSDRRIGVHLVPANGSAPVPDEAIAAYKAKGPGIRKMFADGLLVVEVADPAPKAEPAPRKKKSRKSKAAE